MSLGVRAQSLYNSITSFWKVSSKKIDTDYYSWKKSNKEIQMTPDYIGFYDDDIGVEAEFDIDKLDYWKDGEELIFTDGRKTLYLNSRGKNMRYVEKSKRVKEKRYTLSSLDELRDYFSKEMDDWKTTWVYDTGLSYYTKQGRGYCHIDLNPSLPYMWVETDNIILQLYNRDIKRIYVTGGTFDIYLNGGLDSVITLGR